MIAAGSTAGLGIAAVAFLGKVSAQSGPIVATPSPEASPAASPAASTGLTVEMGEFYFKPNTFTIPANTNYTITLVNKGLVGHDLTLEDPAQSSGNVDPGKTGSITLNLPAGKYQFICSVEGHADAGMYGTITVE